MNSIKESIVYARVIEEKNVADDKVMATVDIIALSGNKPIPFATVIARIDDGIAKKIILDGNGIALGFSLICTISDQTAAKVMLCVEGSEETTSIKLASQTIIDDMRYKLNQMTNKLDEGNETIRVLRQENSEKTDQVKKLETELTAKKELDKSLSKYQRDARKIMGDNFIDPFTLMKLLNRKFTREELSSLKNHGYSLEDLSSLRHSHLLLPTFAISLQELKLDYDLKINQDLDTQPMETGWLLIRKGGVPESYQKTFEDKQKLLTRSSHYWEEVPTATELIYSDFVCHRTGQSRFMSDIKFLIADQKRFGGAYWDYSVSASNHHYGYFYEIKERCSGDSDTGYLPSKLLDCSDSWKKTNSP